MHLDSVFVFEIFLNNFFLYINITFCYALYLYDDHQPFIIICEVVYFPCNISKQINEFLNLSPLAFSKGSNLIFIRNFIYNLLKRFFANICNRYRESVYNFFLNINIVIFFISYFIKYLFTDILKKRCCNWATTSFYKVLKKILIFFSQIQRKNWY